MIEMFARKQAKPVVFPASVFSCLSRVMVIDHLDPGQGQPN